MDVNFFYQIMRKSYEWKIPFLPVFFMRIIRILFACDIHFKCKLGDGTILKHNGLGVVIHPKAVIGKNVLIYQNVSIAGRNNRGTPIIGNNVIIGAGACILGGISIGDNCRIGANAVVLSDIPENSTAVGVPAKVVIKNE